MNESKNFFRGGQAKFLRGANLFFDGLIRKFIRHRLEQGRRIIFFLKKFFPIYLRLQACILAIEVKIEVFQDFYCLFYLEFLAGCDFFYLDFKIDVKLWLVKHSKTRSRSWFLYMICMRCAYLSDINRNVDYGSDIM